MNLTYLTFIAGCPLLNYNVQQRHISVSASLLGKRNVRKFFLGNKRGTKMFRRDQALGKYDDIAPIYSKLLIAYIMYRTSVHIIFLNPFSLIFLLFIKPFNSRSTTRWIFV